MGLSFTSHKRIKKNINSHKALFKHKQQKDSKTWFYSERLPLQHASLANSN